jgi:phosphoesterase RecJ-like protein
VSLKKVVECVRKNKIFLITSHKNLEGDALGSELAFYRLLRAKDKKAVIINDDDLPYGYEFLPGVKGIVKYKGSLKGLKFDCLAVLDCSDLSRSGEVAKINIDKKPVLNIDHHISNLRFGDIKWVDPKASSCSEMIYRLYKELRVPLDKISATYLYAGILTDTGSFKYTNTTSFTHQAVSELLRHNLNVVEIYQNIYGNIPIQDAKLLIRVLAGIKRGSGGKVIWFEIDRKMLKNKKVSFDLGENILSFGRGIKDAEVVVLFKENLGPRDEIRVNLRSHGNVDVNKIAAYFGGGGHKTASGCTIKGKIAHVRSKVLRKIKESLE